MLQIGLNVIFDVGGCIEYTDALVSITPGQGTCDKSVTRTLTLNKKVMCKECVVKCMASTDCKSSSEASVTVEPGLCTIAGILLCMPKVNYIHGQGGPKNGA